MCLVVEMDRAQQLHRPALRPGHAVKAGLYIERLVGREEGVEQDFLVDDADRRLGIARVAIDVETPDRGGAAGLVDEPGEDVDQRRLDRKSTRLNSSH